MRNLETKMNNQITKTAENRYFPYIYVCSFKKHANFMSFYKNIFRREIPKWNGSSCGAFFSKETLSLLESLRISSKEGSPLWKPHEGLCPSNPLFGQRDKYCHIGCLDSGFDPRVNHANICFC